MGGDLTGRQHLEEELVAFEFNRVNKALNRGVLKFVAFKGEWFKCSEIKDLKVIDETECYQLGELRVNRNASDSLEDRLPIPIELAFASLPLELMFAQCKELVAL